MHTFSKVIIFTLLTAALSGYFAQIELVNAQLDSVPIVETTETVQSTATATATPTFIPTLTPLPLVFSANRISFYGRAFQLDNKPVPPGKVIEAYDPNGQLCGAYRVDTTGKYGFLTCALDDPNTPADEGVAPGDIVYFKVDGQDAGTFQLPLQLKSGARFNATPIMVPEPVTILLFGTGLLGLAAHVRRQANKRTNITLASTRSRKGEQP